ncbi:hypothetical protein DASC09_014290 [Saccharomycopsis crataegensis]|uniref:Uncharacterized protein n=1 Tax=Saccharomycopsis crataegensis TaxID=43959 RepID=A0AAV5QH94_9ASCO|nr:hypothetical protein DASC09_014290 [Saccharomycopsis crataegensis]
MNAYKKIYNSRNSSRADEVNQSNKLASPPRRSSKKLTCFASGRPLSLSHHHHRRITVRVRKPSYLSAKYPRRIPFKDLSSFRKKSTNSSHRRKLKQLSNSDKETAKSIAELNKKITDLTVNE